MQVEVAARNDLEQRLSVEVDLVVVVISLVVDIGISEAALMMVYPLEMISPLFYLLGTVLTPCSRRISPHLIFS